MLRTLHRNGHTRERSRAASEKRGVKCPDLANGQAARWRGGVQGPEGNVVLDQAGMEMKRSSKNSGGALSARMRIIDSGVLESVSK
jgi:hypothetical protein